MDWIQFVLFIVAMMGIDFFSNRSIKEEMSIIKQKIDNDNKNVMNIILSIKDEIKDFHGRLCAIEERYRSGK